MPHKPFIYDRPIYVSITGLKVKNFWKFLFFMRHAVMSKIQADRAPGILFSDVRTINGIQHTVTAWETKQHMKDFIYTGNHLKAIKAFRKIATGKTFGYEATQIPSWEEVPVLWEKNGKSY